MKRHLTTIALVVAMLHAIAASAYQLLGDVWEDAEVTIFLDINGTSSSGTTWNDAFLEAMDKWNQAVGSFSFLRRQQFSAPCAGYVPEIPENGNTNGVGFYDDACGEPFGRDTLALTLSLSDGNGNFTESDIVFNNNIVWNVYSGPDRVSSTDFRRVAVHELGHVMGLDHEPREPAIMAAFIGDREEPLADDIAGAHALYPPANGPDPIVLTLEEPAVFQSVSGVSNIRGWAVATSGIISIQAFLDGQLLAEIPYGGSRIDVGNAYPGYPDSDDSGFSMAFAWSLLSSGSHTLMIRATDSLGRISETTHGFAVVRFASGFVSNPANVVIRDAPVVTGSNTISLPQVSVEGRNYSVILNWNTASQKFEMTNITPE
jgi:hypothetical protein